MAPPPRAPYPAARALVGLGRLALGEGDHDGAQALFSDALEVACQAADAYLAAPCLEAMGALAIACGDHDGATSLLDQALNLARRHHDRMTEAAALTRLGRLARAEGDPAGAAAHHWEALGLRARVGDRPGMADSLEALGGAGVAGGHPVPAVRLLAAGHRLRQRLEHPRPAGEAEIYRADVAAARAALGAAFDTEWDRGARLAPEEAVALAACARFVRPADTRWEALSPAECQVVNLVAEGLTNADIAERLGISPHTVRSHLRSVFAKLGLPNRATLMEEVQAR
jgi:DNA-binding CsgD family transcriptional regulator